jgi:hypothetical protein
MILLGRSFHGIQKSGFVRLSALSKSFRNIRRNGYRGSAHLARQTIDFVLRECRCQFIDLQNKLMSFLPNYQVFKILRGQ